MESGFHKALFASFFFLGSLTATCIPAQQAPSGLPAVPAANAAADSIPDAPAAQTGAISGTVTDVLDEIVPGATVVLEGGAASDVLSTVANDLGVFEFKGLKPGVVYHVVIKAKGFVDWQSSSIVLAPGQYQFVPGVQLKLAGEQTSITVYASTTELATEQVKLEEEQRIFGLIPNFYVVYDSSNVAPMTAKMKYRMALKVSTDPITMAGVLFMAAVNQGVETPSYPLGARGYGQRVGAVAADGFSDILIGGAVLPSLLHQDPRYYFKGTGSNRSRFLHAVSYPFICHGDNGHLQPNFSTIGGDAASSALENLYFPSADRNGVMIAQEFLISTIERTASSLTQEFILHRFTSRSKSGN
jgi:hypothetical protein